MQNHLKYTLIVVFFSSLLMPPHATANSDDLKSSYLRLGVGFISDSFSGRLTSTSSEALSFDAQWMNRSPFEWFVEDRNYFSIELMLNSEQHAEKFDIDRDPLSTEFSALFQRPFTQLSSGAQLSLIAEFEFLQNAQQTEEFEYTIYVGLAYENRFTGLGDTSFWGAVGAVACNEEEKDDDLPMSLFELDRDQLKRKGCGYYTHLYSTLFITENLSWLVSADYYSGDYGEKFYRRQRYSTYIRWFLSNNHSIHVGYRLIRRDSERDFLGMDDDFHQIGIGYSHQF